MYVEIRAKLLIEVSVPISVESWEDAVGKSKAMETADFVVVQAKGWFRGRTA